MIERKKEIEELERLYNSNKAEFVAVYGRRRVGKTYLIDNVFKGRIFFKHAGLSPDDEYEDESELKKQLDQFYSSLISSGLSESSKMPKTWFDAFRLLQKLIFQKDNGTRMVLFIDELPWMDTRKSNFIKAFEGFWNSFACSRNNLMLIVCGSATSWIQNNLINNYGGLYGRITYEIKLKPFSLKGCEDYFKSRNISLSRYDIVNAYMIFGGIPYYLNYIDSRYSLPQNVDNIFFKNNAKLSLEYDRLFRSIFTFSEKAKEIVKFLFSNNLGYTKKEIVAHTKISDGGTLTKYLDALIASDFVIKYVPFGYSKREERYKLIDPFCIFYLTFVINQQNNENFWTQNSTSQKLSSWRGYAFENVCFNHIVQVKYALGISGVITTASAFYCKEDGYQIDLAIKRNDNIINLCELKFYSNPFTVNKEYFFKINNRSNLLMEKISKKYIVKNTLITTFGITKNEYYSVFSNVLTMDDLFGI